MYRHLAVHVRDWNRSRRKKTTTIWFHISHGRTWTEMLSKISSLCIHVVELMLNLCMNTLEIMNSWVHVKSISACNKCIQSGGPNAMRRTYELNDRRMTTYRFMYVRPFEPYDVRTYFIMIFDMCFFSLLSCWVEYVHEICSACMAEWMDGWTDNNGLLFTFIVQLNININ